jgi:hypothetical protein
MAYKALLAALSMAAIAAPLSATNPPPPADTPSASDSAGTRYCLRVGPLTGNISETVQCWTRDEWADQDVDLDKEWALNGVSIIRA